MWPSPSSRDHLRLELRCSQTELPRRLHDGPDSPVKVSGRISQGTGVVEDDLLSPLVSGQRSYTGLIQWKELLHVHETQHVRIQDCKVVASTNVAQEHAGLLRP